MKSDKKYLLLLLITVPYITGVLEYGSLWIIDWPLGPRAVVTCIVLAASIALAGTFAWERFARK